MTRLVRSAVVALAWFCWDGTAHAQFGRPRAGVPYTPTTSPYLNLNRRGASSAINYYNLVRPEIEFRNSIQSLQGQVNRQQQTVGQIVDELGNPATGHSVRFMNLSHYFGGVGRGPAGAGPQRPPARR